MVLCKQEDGIIWNSTILVQKAVENYKDSYMKMYKKPPKRDT